MTSSTTTKEIQTSMIFEQTTSTVQETSRRTEQTSLRTQPTSSTSGTSVSQQSSTTKQYCEHMEYINTLVAIDAVQTSLEDISNKAHFIDKGVDFHGTNPIIVIDIPEDGAIIRDVALPSNNIERIRVTLTTVSDITLPAIEGAPTDLPSDQFPTEKIDVILIEILSTFDNKAPRGVTISVVACAPGITTSTTKGNWIEFNVYNE